MVPNHLLGKDALPGGTIGDYDADGSKYQLFIIETDSAQDAAILLLDLKATLKDPAYIAYMGGYFGTDAGGTGLRVSRKRSIWPGSWGWRRTKRTRLRVNWPRGFISTVRRADGSNAALDNKEPASAA